MRPSSASRRPPGGAPVPESEEIGAHYGPLKALCERAVEAALPGRALVIRPGLVVGSHDYTGRFGYWPRRVAAGGEVLAPGRPESRVWLLDARDLAEWMIRLVEERASGVFNAAGPPVPLSFGRLLEQCKEITGSEARFVWVGDDFLLARGVVPYTELPLWVPELDGGYPELDLSRAIGAGLTLPPARGDDPRRPRRRRVRSEHGGGLRSPAGPGGARARARAGAACRLARRSRGRPRRRQPARLRYVRAAAARPGRPLSPPGRARPPRRDASRSSPCSGGSSAHGLVSTRGETCQLTGAGESEFALRCSLARALARALA